MIDVACPIVGNFRQTFLRSLEERSRLKREVLGEIRTAVPLWTKILRSECSSTVLVGKLMRLGPPNRIDDFESNLKSEFERRIVVDSDTYDLIESTISIFD